MIEPAVVKLTIFCAQVCVPANYTDEQARAFLEYKQPCGTENGWQMRHTGDKLLAGAPERVPCKLAERKGCVHIMFDA